MRGFCSRCLGQLPDPSATLYKGRDLDPQKFGHELGVESVLIGRILRFADDVLIRMELVNVDHGWQRWGDEYKEKISAVLALHETIARDISEKVCAKLTNQIPQRLPEPLAPNVCRTQSLAGLVQSDS